LYGHINISVGNDGSRPFNAVHRGNPGSKLRIVYSRRVVVKLRRIRRSNPVLRRLIRSEHTGIARRFRAVLPHIFVGGGFWIACSASGGGKSYAAGDKYDCKALHIHLPSSLHY
jgi:hypothetical protein